jgi:hypothetical protein
VAILHRRAQQKRRESASTRAIRAIEQRLSSLPELDPAEQRASLAALGRRIDRLATRLQRTRISHRGLRMRIACWAHTDRDAVGQRWMGYRHVLYLCAECFETARQEDEAEN